MKRAIFYLLFSCAFQKVFADKPDAEYNSPSEQFVRHFHKVVDGFIKPILDAADAVKIEGISNGDIIYNCWGQEQYDKFINNLNEGRDQCDQCYSGAPGKNNAEDGKKCCDKVTADMAERTKKDCDTAMQCIAKCAKLGAGCKKMLMKPNSPPKDSKSRKE